MSYVLVRRRGPPGMGLGIGGFGAANVGLPADLKSQVNAVYADLQAKLGAAILNAGSRGVSAASLNTVTGGQARLPAIRDRALGGDTSAMKAMADFVSSAISLLNPDDERVTSIAVLEDVLVRIKDIDTKVGAWAAKVLRESSAVARDVGKNVAEGGQPFLDAGTSVFTSLAAIAVAGVLGYAIFKFT